MNCEFKFQFKLYQKYFKQPLRTSHGEWRVREGIIISLTNSAGQIGRGEIAPLPWFGSETVAQAEEFCRQLGETVTKQEIMTIDDSLPCCQFAVESALLALDRDCTENSLNLNFCYLLPAGEQALNTWQDLFHNQNAATFKWKIGVLPLAAEINILKQLVADLPPGVKLRLDANGGLNINQARKLLSTTESFKAIEFIEQPLAPESLDDIFQLSQEYETLLALDESIASFEQLRQAQQRGWRGVYVIKTAIMGYSSRLTRFCQSNDLDVVFSSVFETEVGRETVLNLTEQLSHSRALGFGVKHLFE
ncbi:MAG: o-succinylbenzoate synthase [Cyanobacteria bacterium J06600_6]